MRHILTPYKRKICELDARSIAYYRRNPCIACRDLLGIELTDAQKYILQSAWNATNSAWVCSRNFGKSFLGAIFMILKAVLYENQAIYILGSVGAQSKETFTKIEEIVARIGKTAASIDSLKDIMAQETVKNGTNKTGFSHDPSGYEVSFYNGSAIFTLNSRPDSSRSRRATLVFFDEAAFCSEELILACEAFATQNTGFKTSTEEGFDPTLLAPRVPTQLVYASSQDEMDTLFYRHYKDFAMHMIAGDRNYFAADMNCETAIQVYMNGKPYTPLLTRAKVDSSMRANKDKALREYYNKPTRDGGSEQIVKWGNVRNCEKFLLPTLCWQPKGRYCLAFDPARINDNSIVGVMNIYQDPIYGFCGDVINCVNFIDTNSEHHYKLNSMTQLKNLRKMILAYNGDNPEYDFIDSILIDKGAGGGGQNTYADGLLEDFTDDGGHDHRGLIDGTSPIYTEIAGNYPHAVDKVRLIEPKKWRTQMVEEMIELIQLGVIHFPFEYHGQDFITLRHKLDDKDEEAVIHELSSEEMNALTQIDLMKTEVTSIQRYKNSENTGVSYALAKDKENSMHDDRFYVLILLAHRLYELRRGHIVEPEVEEHIDAPMCVSAL